MYKERLGYIFKVYIQEDLWKTKMAKDKAIKNVEMCQF